MRSKFWQNITQAVSATGVAAFLLALAPAGADAQLWQSTHHYSGSDIGRSVLLLSDNMVVTAGEKMSGTSSADVVVVKTDPCGDVIWSYPYDIGGRDQVGRIRATADDGFIVVGTTQNINSDGCGTRDDIFLLKLASSGTVEWCRVYGGCALDEGRDVQVAEDGYIVAGSTTSYGAGGVDAYLMKTDLNGNPLWGKTYGGTGLDFFTSCTIAPNDEIVAVGETFSYTDPSNGDIFVHRVNQLDGGPTIGFPKRYGGELNDLAWSVLVEPLTGYIVIAGGTKSYGGNSEAFLLMLNSTGTPIRMKTIGGQMSNGWDEFLDMTKYGTFYLVTGLFNYAPGGWGAYDMFVGLFDGSFNTISTTLHGGTGDDQGWGVATNPNVSGDQNIVATGLTNSLGVSSQDLYTIRQTDLGYTGCADADPDLDIEDVEPEYTSISVSMTNAAAWCGRRITPGTHTDEPQRCVTSCDLPKGKVNEVEGGTTEAGTLKIYPNPVATTGAFVLEYAPAEGAATEITVTDMAGKLISQQQLPASQGRAELSTKGWAAGNYIVQVKTGERTQTRPITVLQK